MDELRGWWSRRKKKGAKPLLTTDWMAVLLLNGKLEPVGWINWGREAFQVKKRTLREGRKQAAPGQVPTSFI